jgi:RNA polymerase sigma-70 factor, ECF subfamily
MNPNDVTQLLGAWSDGEGEALDEVMALVYEELRRLAHRHMAGERAGHTLQTTALVNEAYLKLKQQRGAQWQNRSQFFAVAAQMMRRILVDYARRTARDKRGGGALQVPLDDAMWIVPEKSAEMLAVDAALQRLEAIDKRRSQIAVMRFFTGLSVDEIAEALAISKQTVQRDWRLTAAWLRRELRAPV